MSSPRRSLEFPPKLVEGERILLEARNLAIFVRSGGAGAIELDELQYEQVCDGCSLYLTTHRLVIARPDPERTGHLQSYAEYRWNEIGRADVERERKFLSRMEVLHFFTCTERRAFEYRAIGISEPEALASKINELRTA